MIPDNHAKSFLSKSYVNAVATQAGFGCRFNEPDYGIDAEISEVQFLPNGRYVNSGYHFNVQIKASHNFAKNNGFISYTLDVDAYNRLIYHVGGLIILVLFCLPKNPDDRLLLTEDFLELRNCCYWFHTKGSPINNKRSISLHIPRSQMFDAKACNSLMDCVKDGTW